MALLKVIAESLLFMVVYRLGCLNTKQIGSNWGQSTYEM